MKIELEHIKKKYKDFELDCTMAVTPGQVTGLIGRNGAGKSTTFKAVLGLIHTDGGYLRINGEEKDIWSAEEKSLLGVVLSESGFSGYLTVTDVIRIMRASYDTFDPEDFRARCRRFSIPLNKQIKEFSTGMKAKLKVLTALSHRTEVLILDEPTSGLDVIAREEILEMLHEYMQEENHSILISSHISGDLEAICDDIYLIEDGRILFHEDAYKILDEYGVLKVTEEQYKQLDQTYILAKKQEHMHCCCLTDQKQFYLENYPELIVEKATLDEAYSILTYAYRRGGDGR